MTHPPTTPPDQFSFSDRLDAAIKRVSNPLCAGLDPTPAGFPKYLVATAQASAGDNPEQFIHTLLVQYYSVALDALHHNIAIIKPNLAFFEQFGIGGLSALAKIIKLAREREMIVIADAKRGDIGSTASAYSAAFLGATELEQFKFEDFSSDALTVNPFLGFDTLAPMLECCAQNKRGIFVLVRTSNPGFSDLQSMQDSTGSTASQKIAAWLTANSAALSGSCGLSGLGAVVGATNSPESAAQLREQLPHSWLLIPGVGAQGADMKDIVPYLTHERSGVIVPLSRGLFSAAVVAAQSNAELASALKSISQNLNREFDSACSKMI